MSEYIVRETGYPGAIQQEIVGELVRCKDCEWWRTGGATFIHEPFCELTSTRCDEDHYCGWAERRSDESERKDP